MNNEPVINFGEYEARPDNASLFMFIGQTVLPDGFILDNHLVNHVFIAEERGEETVRGAYALLADYDEETQTKFLNFMIQNGYTVHLNLHEVPECDLAVWKRRIDQTIQAEQIPDEIPDSWDE